MKLAELFTNSVQHTNKGEKMNKTILFGAVVLSLLALFGYKSNAQIKEENNTVKNETPKILIAYYSYSGNTKEVAEAIHKLVGGDLFEIKTEGSYPEEYRPMTTQAKKKSTLAIVLN